VIGETRITFTELNIGDVGIELFIFADLQAVEGVLVAVSGELFALEESRLFYVQQGLVSP